MNEKGRVYRSEGKEVVMRENAAFVVSHLCVQFDVI